MKIVVKAKSLKHAFSRLRVTGLRINVDELDEPKGRPEEWAEICTTPPLYVDDGDVVFSVMVRDEMVSKLPPQDTPNFSIVWREDVNTIEEWPHYTNSEGVIQGCGMFA